MCNLFIEGLPEIAGQRTVDTVLLTNITVDIGPAELDSASRLGARRVKVKNATLKKDIYSNVRRLQTHLYQDNDDLPPKGGVMRKVVAMIFDQNVIIRDRLLATTNPL